MKAFVSHGTALRYWREHFPLDGALGSPAIISNAESYASRKMDLISCIPETYRSEDAPTGVLVFDERHRAWSQGFACHIWSTALPANAFYRVHDMYVSSPEFVFLQMASELTVVQLIALGCELCGTYILEPKAKRLLHISSGDAPRRAEPLTNLEKLDAFLSAAKGGRHLVKARRAMRYVCEGSRSPMETMTYMLLCLPPLLGGYGLPCPVLNPVIPIGDEARTIANRSWCEGDICWQKQYLDVEYNGESHAGSAKMRDDAGRVIGLEHEGWKVMTVTGSQVFDVDKFEVVAKEVAKHLGHRVHLSTLGHLPARMALRHDLDIWMENE